MAPVLSPPESEVGVTKTVTGGAVCRLVLGPVDAPPSSPFRSEPSEARADREVMTEVGSCAACKMVVVCRPAGQAAVVYTGALMHEFVLP